MKCQINSCENEATEVVDIFNVEAHICMDCYNKLTTPRPEE